MKIYMDITEVSGKTWALSATAQGLNPNLVICFLGGSDGKEYVCNAGDPGSIPGLKDPLEKEMVTQSSILAWRIPWTDEPGGLQSMEL